MISKIRKNPFPRLSIPTNPTFIYDPEGVVARLLRHLELVVRHGDKTTIAVVGGYGYGKTHVLLYLKNELEKRGVESLYVASPGTSFMDLYRTLAEHFVKFVKRVRKLRELDELDPELLKALNYLDNDDENSFYSYMWLVGEKIPLNVRRRLGLGSNINTVKAMRFAAAMLHTLRNFRGAVALFIDELEELLQLTRLKRFAYMELLRNLIDSMPPNSILVTALTPACWDDILNNNAALARRLSTAIIYLRNLRRDELKPFLELYLRNSGYKESLESFIASEVLDYLYELSNGNPGEVLRLAAILMDEVIIPHNRVATLSDAKKVLSAYI